LVSPANAHVLHLLALICRFPSSERIDSHHESMVHPCIHSSSRRPDPTRPVRADGVRTPLRCRPVYRLVTPLQPFLKSQARLCFGATWLPLPWLLCGQPPPSLASGSSLGSPRFDIGRF